VELRAADEVTWNHDPFACVAMECWLADEQGYEVRDRIWIKIHEAVQAVTLDGETRQRTENAETNASGFQYSVSVLFDNAPGSHAVVIGAGPSLTGQLDWLKSSGLRPIIACTTALAPLERAGIPPDVVVVMEWSGSTAGHLEGVDLDRLRRTVLAYNPEAPPALVSKWPGAKCHIGGLYLGGTVLHTATDLATRMGAAEVTLLGFDCCTPAGRHYAAGAGASSSGYGDTVMRMWTVDGHSERVVTRPDMTQWHRGMEDLIAARPSVRFYKRGRAGVPLKGCTWTD
jgi:hypothetical protein